MSPLFVDEAPNTFDLDQGWAPDRADQYESAQASSLRKGTLNARIKAASFDIELQQEEPILKKQRLPKVRKNH